jgi:hypothetical protein
MSLRPLKIESDFKRKYTQALDVAAGDRLVFERWPHDPYRLRRNNKKQRVRVEVLGLKDAKHLSTLQVIRGGYYDEYRPAISTIENGNCIRAVWKDETQRKPIVRLRIYNMRLDPVCQAIRDAVEHDNWREWQREQREAREREQRG